uniref:Uncharacterized protein n=1 Tax=Cacopsylla melanoneura TaxID=428564 RepID=A0A8D8X1D7_9HEMI
MPISATSFFILSIHLSLGLPLDLRSLSSSRIILFGILSSSILATCPAYFNLLSFKTCTILGAAYFISISLFFKLRHRWVIGSWIGPYILRRTFLSKMRNLFSSLN